MSFYYLGDKCKIVVVIQNGNRSSKSKKSVDLDLTKLHDNDRISLSNYIEMKSIQQKRFYN